MDFAHHLICGERCLSFCFFFFFFNESFIQLFKWICLGLRAFHQILFFFKLIFFLVYLDPMATFDSQGMWNGIHITIIFENGFTDNKFLIIYIYISGLKGSTSICENLQPAIQTIVLNKEGRRDFLSHSQLQAKQTCTR